MVRVYTVGHSNRSSAALIEVLASADVTDLVDVRAHPGSRHNPQFRQAPLRAALADAGVRYHWAGQRLGGLRKATAGSPHHALPAAMQGYAEHMHSEAFAHALAQLRRLAARGPVAIMCAELDPARCHRSLIADVLLSGGDEVLHLINTDAPHPHRLNPAARRTEKGLIYDRLTQGALDLG